ncbi:hypothetical protein GV828_00705 [Flavobacterium sp. NST-5]|uniref:Uncharacterized protein n=1 Tax=Flavobacterium ichthyis TaxID=2698827 RepID=A0ABW9Z4F2_9FLAO|nr:hypothetical protein [Flavobacterium ichthyis]NBL63713.1 hypothetical protein [Flavobacterium ichthyis]
MIENKGNLGSVISISTEEIDLQNLNDSFNGFPENKTIVSIGFLNFQNVTGWIFTHHYDSSNILKFNCYKINNLSELELTEYQDIVVSNIILNNIIYVANELAPGADIEIIGIKELLTMHFNSPYDDLSLMNFRSSYNLDKYNHLDDLSLVDGSGGGCGITHHCWSGGGQCHPFGGGCRERSCGRTGMSNFIQEFSTSDNYHLFNSVISIEKSYEVRDELNDTNNGKFFVDAFYSISDHLNSSTDLFLAMELISNLDKYDEIISAFTSNNSSLIVTDEHIESISSILLISSSKSDSDVYKVVTNDLIKISNRFRNKNLNDIKLELSN